MSVVFYMCIGNFDLIWYLKTYGMLQPSPPRSIWPAFTPGDAAAAPGWTAAGAPGPTSAVGCRISLMPPVRRGLLLPRGCRISLPRRVVERCCGCRRPAGARRCRYADRAGRARPGAVWTVTVRTGNGAAQFCTSSARYQC